MGSFVMASLHRGTQILWQRDGIFSYSYFYNHNKTYCQFCQSYITLVCAPHSPTQLRTWFKKYFIDTLHKAACIALTKQHFNKINTVGHITYCNNRHYAAAIVIFPMWILTRTLARIQPAITGGAGAEYWPWQPWLPGTVLTSGWQKYCIGRRKLTPFQIINWQSWTWEIVISNQHYQKNSPWNIPFVFESRRNHIHLNICDKDEDV